VEQESANPACSSLLFHINTGVVHGSLFISSKFSLLAQFVFLEVSGNSQNVINIIRD